MAKQFEVKMRLRQLKHQYLEDCGGTPGSKSRGLDFVLAQPDVMEMLAQHSAQLLHPAWTSIWKEEPPARGDDADGQMRLFCKSLPETLTVFGPEGSTKDGELQRVLIEYATVEHLRQDAFIARSKAEQSMDASVKKEDQVEEALRRSGGDTSALLLELLDEDSAAA